MNFGTVCSGIGAPETAWRALEWRCAFMSEIEPQACAVLAHHNEGVPLHGDFTTIQAGQYASIDVLCGGTPCQSFSVAGLRGGMADARGNLALEYLRLADRLRPRWVVWENVPGVLSSNDGRDFGAFLGGLGQLGYGWAYRVLDAQFFNLAQRRERVFVVGYLGDWRRAAAVLFEPASLRGDSPPSREKREGVADRAAQGAGSGGVAGAFTANAYSGGAGGRPEGAAGNHFLPVANPLGAKRDGGWRGDLDNDTFVPAISPALKSRDFKGPSSDGDGDDAPLIAFPIERGNRGAGGNIGFGNADDPMFTLQTAHAHACGYRTSPNNGAWETGERTDALTQQTDPNSIVLRSRNVVRRLMPVECLRLQGFDDTHLDILYRGKPLADGPKYRLIGNSMAVPVLRKIGERIKRFNAMPVAVRELAA